MSMRFVVQGLPEMRKAFRTVEPAIREQCNEATEITAKALALDAAQRVPVDTGTLRDHIAWRMSKRTGFARVGIKDGRVAVAGAGGSALTRLGARLLEARKYGSFVHFGTSKMNGTPFMTTAAEGQRVLYARRLRDAGQRAERQLASGRFL